MRCAEPGSAWAAPYRTTRQYLEALAALEQGLVCFPNANELKVFRAMVCYNMGRHKEGMESLLAVLAETTTAPALIPYRRAMALYATDLDRRW